jgi:hypothetical protein
MAPRPTQQSGLSGFPCYVGQNFQQQPNNFNPYSGVNEISQNYSVNFENKVK